MLGLLLWGGAAEAHPALASAVNLRVGAAEVVAEVQIPTDQLAMALERRPDPVGPLPGAEALAVYAADHVELRDPEGHAYGEEIVDAALTTVDGAPYLVTHLRFTPPAGAPITDLTLVDDAVLHVVESHKIYVSVEGDLGMAQLAGGDPRLVGVLHHGRTGLLVERDGASILRGFTAALGLGARHIAEGTDHLLFLLALVLVGPLRATAGRWGGEPSPRAVFGRLAAVVTAFSLGHSVTLALGALGLVRLPSAPVELAVAASILVAAVHALRPVFPGREAWIAGTFGLLHGLAFAGALEGLGFDRAGLLTILSGFNLGVEVVQLAVVLAVAPALLGIVRGPLGGSLRVSGASFAALAALGWMGERAFGLPNPMATLVEAARVHAALLLGGLYVLAAASLLRRGVPRSSAERLLPLGGPS